MTIGERIKKLRKELSLTQQEFAERIGLKPTAVLMYEKGNRNVTEQSLTLICREFKVRETWLREGEGEMFADEDASLLAQIAAEYHLDENARALAKTFLSLSAERRAVIVQAVKILAEEYAAQAAQPHYNPPAADAGASETSEEPDEDGLTAAERAELDAEMAEIRRMKILEKTSRTSTASHSIA